MDVHLAVMFAFVLLITLLPLVAILPSGPPLVDDMPHPARHAGWRITITIARQDGQETSRDP